MLVKRTACLGRCYMNEVQWMWVTWHEMKLVLCDLRGILLDAELHVVNLNCPYMSDPYNWDVRIGAYDFHSWQKIDSVSFDLCADIMRSLPGWQALGSNQMVSRKKVIASHGSCEVYTFNSMKKANFLSMHGCTYVFHLSANWKPKVSMVTPEWW